MGVVGWCFGGVVGDEGEKVGGGGSVGGEGRGGDGDGLDWIWWRVLASMDGFLGSNWSVSASWIWRVVAC